MSTVLIPAVEGLCPDQVADSPFHRLTSLSRQDLAATLGLPAHERRLLTEHFRETFQWEAVRSLLPLRLVALPDVPPWEPRRCRSFYIWLPPDDIRSADDWDGLDDFDPSALLRAGLVLRLFDFSPWRPIPSASSGQAWGNASAATWDRLPSTRSAWACPSCWPAGETGGGCSW